jgi:hypothetical protein
MSNFQLPDIQALRYSLLLDSNPLLYILSPLRLLPKLNIPLPLSAFAVPLPFPVSDFGVLVDALPGRPIIVFNPEEGARNALSSGGAYYLDDAHSVALAIAWRHLSALTL